MLGLLVCLSVGSQAQTHLVNQGHLTSGGGFVVLSNTQLANNGTINHSTGTLKVMGAAADANSSIGGTSTSTVQNLTVSKTANNVVLNQSLTVNGIVSLEGGHIDLQANDLTAGVVIGATANRYIKTRNSGQLKQQVSVKAITFPVGNSSYNPIVLSNTGAVDVLGVRVEDQVLKSLTSGAAIADASVNRVWHISEAVAGGSMVNANLQWNAAEELPNFDRNQAAFAAFEGNAWVTKNSGNANGSDPYDFTGMNLTELKAFTIGNVVCELNGLATLGTVSPKAGTDQLDVCGTTVNLAATTPEGTTGQWSASMTNGANPNFGDAMNISSSLTGVFGGIYTLRWTVGDGACQNVFDEVQISFNPDEDLPGGLPDGVQDCMDICLGGDDTKNTDGFGAPDDCDCNLEEDENEFVDFNDAQLTAAVSDAINILGADTIQPSADFEMTSTGTIEAKAVGVYPTVVMRGGNNVRLLPGFHAKAGSDFLAKAEYCRDPLTGAPTLLPPAVALQSRNIQPLTPNPTLTIELPMQLAIQPTISRVATTISLQVPQAQQVTMTLYNQHGQFIRTLFHPATKAEGTYEFPLDTHTLTSGIYFVRLQGEQMMLTEKMVVAR